SQHFGSLLPSLSFPTRRSSDLITVLSIVAARVLWGGILTVRAAVWTANYPRNVLARITGRIAIVNAIAVATSAALVGWVLEAQEIGRAHAELQSPDHLVCRLLL